jgi:hypothetical protein
MPAHWESEVGGAYTSLQIQLNVQWLQMDPCTRHRTCTPDYSLSSTSGTEFTLLFWCTFFHHNYARAAFTESWHRTTQFNGLVIRNVKRDVKCQSVHGGADQSARQRAGNGSSALCSDTLGMLRPDPSSFTETMARERSQNTVRAFALSESTALVMCCV